MVPARSESSEGDLSPLLAGASICALASLWADFHFQTVDQYGHSSQIVLYLLTGPWLLARAAVAFLVPAAWARRGLAADLTIGLFIGHLIVAVLRIDEAARLLLMLRQEPFWRSLIPVAAFLAFAVYGYRVRGRAALSPARIGFATFSVLVLSVAPLLVTGLVLLLGGIRR